MAARSSSSRWARGDQYKFIRYYGLWDIDELFDLKADPEEMHELALKPEFAATAKQMSDRLFEILDQTNGRFILLFPDRFTLFNERTSEPAAGSQRRSRRRS